MSKVVCGRLGLGLGLATAFGFPCGVCVGCLLNLLAVSGRGSLVPAWGGFPLRGLAGGLA
jgi:hypothetical protein